MVLAMFLTATTWFTGDQLHEQYYPGRQHSRQFLSLWLLPGLCRGSDYLFWWFRWRWRFRFLISGGMFCYVIYLAILYFGITRMALTKCSTFLSYSVGMMVCCLSHSAFCRRRFRPAPDTVQRFLPDFLPVGTGTGLSASFFNNMLYYLQVKGMNVLSENMTLTNPIAEQKYNQALNKRPGTGTNSAEAGQLATNSLACTPLCNSNLLLALKTDRLCAGYADTGTGGCSRCSFIPFHKTLKVAVVKTGDDMV